jgi:hypothetical protein
MCLVKCRFHPIATVDVSAGPAGIGKHLPVQEEQCKQEARVYSTIKIDVSFSQRQDMWFTPFQCQPVLNMCSQLSIELQIGGSDAEYVAGYVGFQVSKDVQKMGEWCANHWVQAVPAHLFRLALGLSPTVRLHSRLTPSACSLSLPTQYTLEPLVQRWQTQPPAPPRTAT